MRTAEAPLEGYSIEYDHLVLLHHPAQKCLSAGPLQNMAVGFQVGLDLDSGEGSLLAWLRARLRDGWETHSRRGGA